ncbi:HlyD family secretion protein [Flagellimonas amoyensis]|uniref:HlyD family secretion protein n=1 Tax=Flagellimonas amoyensis TaxID=2169401 RepID=UPI000D3992D6|nr:HlyD family efflux transporter periplasmic adaptor subunit [Allomuricauda amoyensis]
MPNNSLEDIELRSEEVQEILTKVPNWMVRCGNMLFLVLILLVLLLSWFVKYPDIIVSQATVTTLNPPQKEYAKTTGKFDAILVEENELVKPGQPLAVIENTASYNDVFKLKSIIDTIQVNTKDFSFPIDSIIILFLGDIESQYALFENSYIQYQLNKQLQPFASEATANSYSVSELNNRLRSLQSQRDINKTELKFKEKELQRNRSLFDKGVISAQDFESKQLEYAQAERNFKNFESSISQIREAISHAHKTSKGTEINQVKEEMALLKNVIQSFNQLKKAIKEWEYSYVLKSEIHGKVSFLKYWNVNQTVSQGDLVFTTVPKGNTVYLAKLKTPAQNSGKIKVGQRVNIKLENYPETEFGMLQGEIKSISQIPDEEGFYYIDATLPEKLLTSYNKEIDFKQEMRGVAEIITEDMRLIERFFYQFKSTFRK